MILCNRQASDLLSSEAKHGEAFFVSLRPCQLMKITVDEALSAFGASGEGQEHESRQGGLGRGSGHYERCSGRPLISLVWAELV